MKRLFLAVVFVFAALQAQAFCGFYVAKADGALYNKASKVVIVRDRANTVITMGSDYRGAAKDFAMVVPVPRVLKRDDIRTVKAETVDHLDSYTAPRLVEYFDSDPCEPEILWEPMVIEETRSSRKARKEKPIYQRADALGVKIKGNYAVGDYDILILAADQSDGLVTFLKGEGYKLPEGAEPVLSRYIKSGMKFFVAKVNLKRHSASKSQSLPPLQVSFRSRKFMLPIQLGKLNADGPQDTLIMTLTRKGRVVPANYPLIEMPTDFDVPSFVKDYFGDFYKATFNRVVPEHRGGIVLEYAWDMQWCDPCAADPLSAEELRELGVSWAKGGTAGEDVYVTRLHARYTADQMRDDISFRVTDNRANFQGRYVMNHPFTGNVQCEAGQEYVKDTRLRLREEAVMLAKRTGWSPRKIEAQIRKTVPKGYW